MHMSDALISPAVGGAMLAVSAGATALSSRMVKREAGTDLVPLMGVSAAFVFAAQMLNFTIPATGSSGHLGGGLILAILLGPHAAFLAMASILAVQALFFADGGLLALGCNLFNLGFLTCFVAYPFVYLPLAGKDPARWRIVLAAIAAAIAGLQLGAFAVVVETMLSGVSDLPFGAFALLMQPIHLAIGVVEGLATAAVLAFVHGVRPEILASRSPAEVPKRSPRSTRIVLVAIGIAALVMAAGLSRFASTHPDGLEWSIARVTGKDAPSPCGSRIRTALASVQRWTSFMPGYDLPQAGGNAGPDSTEGKGNTPAAAGGTQLAGLVGSAITLLAVGLVGLVLSRWRQRKGQGHPSDRTQGQVRGRESAPGARSPE